MTTGRPIDDRPPGVSADSESAIASSGVSLSAALSLPDAAPIRGGLVPLHPADGPSRDHLLFRHLAGTLPPHGVAVLRYDRRPAPKGGDVPLRLQADDALAAGAALRRHPAVGDVPLGLWGFSQGAWAAPLAAARSADVAFLVLVACSGVSPARQMRYGTAEHLRRAGFGDEALSELAALRATYEDYDRGRVPRSEAQAAVDAVAARPWFPLAWVPRVLGDPGWEDMDLDPVRIFARVRCPVLLFYGEDDEWVPIDDSIAAWGRAAATSGNPDVTVVRLPGTSHSPTLRDVEGGRVSPLYEETLVSWLTERLDTLAGQRSPA